MAAPYNPPVKNEDFQIQISLEDFSNPGRIKTTPTIAAGDFKVSKDGGALANLTTLPSESPAGSGLVTIALSSTEMNADVVTVRWIDQTTPPEWSDDWFSIATSQ